MRESYCYQCLKEAYHRPKTAAQEGDFRNVDRYWFGSFPELAEKTRSIVVSTFSAMTDVMNRNILRELLCTGTNITPLAMEEGKIIVVDLHIAEFSEVGRYAAAIWKYCSQCSLERRNTDESPRPVFLWQDEGQHFVLSSDMMFQTTCRSYRVSNVVSLRISAISMHLPWAGKAARPWLIPYLETSIRKSSTRMAIPSPIHGLPT